MRWSEIYEEGAVGVVANNKKQAKDPRYSMSMTNDVKPGETQRQAAKFGNKLDKKGHPPTLSKKVKGSSTNVLFNLGMAENSVFEALEEKWSQKYKRSINCSNPKGFSQKAHCAGRKKKESVEERLSLKSKSYKKSLGAAKASGRRRKRKLSTKFSEGYKLQLERDPNMYVLHITDTASGKRTEVRGKSGYESGNYDANDKLHQLLDKVGKSANVSELINGEVVSINPKHPDADRAKKATDKAFSEDRKFDRAPDAVMYKSASMKGAGSMITISKDLPTLGRQLVPFWKTENGYETDIERYGDYNDMFKQYYEKGDYQIEENFADGKKKGKSRPGRVKKAGASCKGSVTKLRKQAKKASGERAKMYHWCANMKSGRKK